MYPLIAGCILTIIFLCALGLSGLCFFYHHQRRRPEDEVDLVSNMERSGRRAISGTTLAENGGANVETDFNVHYVVPKEGVPEEHELNVYVSTSNGLKKVERKNSSTSSR